MAARTAEQIGIEVLGTLQAQVIRLAADLEASREEVRVLRLIVDALPQDALQASPGAP